MATGDAIFADEATIWFAPAGTVGADLAANGKVITTYVSNVEDGGGEKSTESIPHFGGAFVNRRKPQEQFTVDLEVTPRHGADSTIFDKIRFGQGIAADGAGDDFVVGMIVIQVTDGTNTEWRAFNNVDCTNFDSSFQASEERKGTLMFKFSPADENGVSNIQFGNASAVTTELTSWS